jgi:coenzyme F420-reducing hydrogenase delta subunit/Pyruvate/2-oxoacid:ferredoxin oxidoreductase delta subunit
MYSLKFAHLVHERLPDAEVYNCYIDMRTPGKGYEEFYNRLLEEGTHFIRGKVADITDSARTDEEEGKLIVQVNDTLIDKQRRIPVDMVILSPAMEARYDSRKITQLFRMGCDFDGFFVERHPKLDPVATMTEGIYIAGACQGPKDIPDSVSQGAAAAARVAGLIARGTVYIEPVRASIIEEQCSGCRICNNLCPYNAIIFNEDKEVSEIITALCQGCGTCVAACPSAAITGAHFTNDQLMSQIEGILWDVGKGLESIKKAESVAETNLRVIRVMCSGRVDPQFVLKALRQGADGVMIAGCHPGECHYVEGNIKALRRFLLLKQMLRQLGIEKERVQLVWASASEGIILADAINRMTEEVRALGPLRWQDSVIGANGHKEGETVQDAPVPEEV